MESYTGEKTEEAVFNNVVVPFAAQYDITATYDEFKAYLEHLAAEDTEMNKDEVAQVAGGRSKDHIYGFAADICAYVGAGIEISNNGGCFLVGGNGGPSWDNCVAEGLDFFGEYGPFN